MRTPSILEKFFFCCSVIALGALASGTKGCQEDYNVAAQLQSTPEATETTTPDPTDPDDDDGDDDDLITQTPTPTPPGGIISTRTATPTNTPRATATSVISVSNPLVSSLETLSTRTAEQTKTSAAGLSETQAQAVPSDGNWLGRAFIDDEPEDALGGDDSGDRSPSDLDDDGYADWVESRFGSDAKDQRSAPSIPFSTNLNSRLSIQGTNSSELNSRLAAGARPAQPAAGDADGDGLTNAYEQQIGTDGALRDSDGDGLNDDIEIFVGSDPVYPDSDKDGVLDRREVDLGLDPLTPEWR